MYPKTISFKCTARMPQTLGGHQECTEPHRAKWDVCKPSAHQDVNSDQAPLMRRFLVWRGAPSRYIDSPGVNWSERSCDEDDRSANNLLHLIRGL